MTLEKRSSAGGLGIDGPSRETDKIIPVVGGHFDMALISTY